MPILQDLFESNRETAHSESATTAKACLERIHGHDAVPLPSRIGGRLPLTCTAIGKALLAFSEPSLAETILAGVHCHS